MSDSGPVSHWRSRAPQFLSVLRIVVAFTYTAHGTSKLFRFPAPMMPGAGPAAIMSLVGAAGVIETFGGALLLVGLFSQPVAFLCAGEMAFAYFTQHAPREFWPLMNGGELAVLYCFVWLYISAAGPGPWSLDALRRK